MSHSSHTPSSPTSHLAPVCRKGGRIAIPETATVTPLPDGQAARRVAYALAVESLAQCRRWDELILDSQPRIPTVGVAQFIGDLAQPGTLGGAPPPIQLTTDPPSPAQPVSHGAPPVIRGTRVQQFQMNPDRRRRHHWTPVRYVELHRTKGHGVLPHRGRWIRSWTRGSAYYFRISRSPRRWTGAKKITYSADTITVRIQASVFLTGLVQEVEADH